MSGILSRLFAFNSVGGKSEVDDYWFQPFGALLGTQAGVEVDADSALRLSAVYACVKVLAEGVASLPLPIYRRRADGGKERATNHPLYGLLHDQPNRYQTSFEWREMGVGHLALRGNAYSEMLAGPRSFVDELMPLHPDRVKVYLMENGDLRYGHMERDGRERSILGDRMLHLRGMSSNGLMGLSVIGAIKDSVGLGMAAEGYGARFFSQDATPRGVLTHPGKLSLDAAKNLAKRWQEARAGLENVHKTAVLDEGMSWEQMSISPKDAQALELRKFQVAEIARIFRVPLHMIGETEKQTSWGTGIEQMTIGFVVYTLMPWLKRLESRINTDLILDRDRQTYFAEFLIDGLLRGDIQSRYEAYGIGIQWGWLSPNEVRTKENLNPRDGGDIYLQPTNMIAAASEMRPYAALLAQEVAGRIVRKETSRLALLGKRSEDDPNLWRAIVRDFYDEHAAFVAETLCIDEGAARHYAETQRDRVLPNGVGPVEEFEENATQVLMRLALGGNHATAEA